MLIWDDDPDQGPPRYVEVDVINVTGPGSIPLLDGHGYQQKRHPMESFRRAGYDGSSPTAIKARHTGPRADKPGRRVCPCGNLASYGHMTCGRCRQAKCACGRIRPHSIPRCAVCTEFNLRMARVRLA